MLPERTREYRDHHLDSTRWDRYRPRGGDVVISTSVKAGTTWMQRIVSLLVFGPDDLYAPLWEISPWIDERFLEPLDVILDRIEGQEHRRFLKSHLPLDALPYDPDLRYIAVMRDTRDVAMSLWNHYSSYTDGIYMLLDAAAPEDGPFPRAPADVGEFWRTWITRAWFDWEPDGWPFWSHHHHATSWWRFREVPNILLVHYNDLLAGLDGEMRRVAAFLDIEVDQATWPLLVEAARFESMKADGQKLLPYLDLGFKQGVDSFLYKGTNGRWREALDAGDLDLYERNAERTLDPDLRRWLEAGRLAVGEPV